MAGLDRGRFCLGEVAVVDPDGIARVEEGEAGANSGCNVCVQDLVVERVILFLGGVGARVSSFVSVQTSTIVGIHSKVPSLFVSWVGGTQQ